MDIVPALCPVLPDEIFLMILSLLDKDTKWNLVSKPVCREWRRVACDKTLWRDLPLTLREALLLSHLNRDITFGNVAALAPVTPMFFEPGHRLGWHSPPLQAANIAIANNEGVDLQYALLPFVGPMARALTLTNCVPDERSLELGRSKDLLGLNRFSKLKQLIFECNGIKCRQQSEYLLAYVLQLDLPLEKLRLDVTYAQPQTVPVLHQLSYSCVGRSLRELHLNILLAENRVPLVTEDRFPVIQGVYSNTLTHEDLFGDQPMPPTLRALKVLVRFPSQVDAATFQTLDHLLLAFDPSQLPEPQLQPMVDRLAALADLKSCTLEFNSAFMIAYVRRLTAMLSDAVEGARDRMRGLKTTCHSNNMVCFQRQARPDAPWTLTHTTDAYSLQLNRADDRPRVESLLPAPTALCRMVHTKPVVYERMLSMLLVTKLHVSYSVEDRFAQALERAAEATELVLPRWAF